jgi:hypothetical protein
MKEHFLAALYEDETHATRAVETLSEDDAVPLDQMSVLARVGAPGDDLLGLLHAGPRERMRAWAGRGAAWGGLLGLLAGATGLVFIPGAGHVMAVGPAANALARGAAGAVAFGGRAGIAAGVAQLTAALQRRGLPADSVRRLREAIDRGRYIVLLRAPEAQLPVLRRRLEKSRPLAIEPPGRSKPR